MTAPLSFPFPDLPALGQTVPVAPGIEWLRMPLPFALDHINLWLVDEGEGRFSAIDSGFALPAVKDAWQSVLVARRLARCVVTHGHPDHLGLAAWLETEYAAPLWISQGEYMAAQLVIEQVGAFAVTGMIDFFAAHGLDAERLAALRSRGNSYRRGVPALPASFRRIYPDSTLPLGGQTWQVITGYGHASEHASLYCAAHGVLISGDMLLPRISTNVAVLSMCPHDDPLQRFLDSIDRFLTLPEDTLVLPSHGRPFHGIHSRVAQLHAHHASRCALLRSACSSAKTAAELIPVLFERDIPDAHQVMFAMGEAIAHLNHLEARGELRRSQDNGIIRYITA